MSIKCASDTDHSAFRIPNSEFYKIPGYCTIMLMSFAASRRESMACAAGS